MKRIFIVLMTTATIFLSCKSKPSVNDLPLNREQIKDVLKAVHLNEGEFKLTTYRFDSIRMDVKAMYDSIFKANGITDSLFFKSYYAYYEHYPDELDSIYGELIDEFQLIKDSLDIKFRDSLMKDRMQFDEQTVEELKLEDHKIEYDD